MSIILTKKKDTSGAPSASDLTNSTGGAELAVNTADKRLYTKDSGGNIVEVGTNPSTITSGAGSFTTLTASGNVGIGTALPANLLHVSGASAGALEMARFRLEGATNNPMLKIEADEANQTAGLDVSGSTATELTFSVAGTERARIDGSGNFGIGTASPAEKLTVATARSYNQSADVAISVGGTDNGFVDNGKTSAWRFNVTGNALNGQSLGFEGFVRGGTWTERARIDGSGNFGIGTSSPSGKLSVNLDGSTELVTLRSSSGRQLWAHEPGGNARPLTIKAQTLTYADDTSTRLIVDASGNVGIGSPGPVSRLEVVNSGVAALYVGYNNTSENYYDANIHYFRNGAGTAERARIDSSGNALIGTITAAGDETNTARVTGGIFSTHNGSQSVATSTATTIATLPSGEGNYIVSASLTSSGAPVDYNAVAVVGTSSSTSAITALTSTAGITLSMSGLNVQVTHFQGTTQTINFSILRLL